MQTRKRTRGSTNGQVDQCVEALARSLHQRTTPQLVPGQLVWAKMPSYCLWPAAVWPVERCNPRELHSLCAQSSEQAAKLEQMLLIKFYGTHNIYTCSRANVFPWEQHTDARRARLKASGGKQATPGNRASMTSAERALWEVDTVRLPDPAAEVDRIAGVDHCTLLDRDRAATGVSLPCTTCSRLLADATCCLCLRHFHRTCVPTAVLSTKPRAPWTCPACALPHHAAPGCAASPLCHCAAAATQNSGKHRVVAVGLTPDMVVEKVAFNVFGLQRPTKQAPHIAGLLDPCTNSLATPNIRAEVLYDEAADGLLPTNQWGSNLVLLNPPFGSTILSKFVDRALNEVEYGDVPAVVLLCPNSTETNYFQRLGPYLRVFMHHTAVRFKDYADKPVAFGIMLVCIVKQSLPTAAALMRRFAAEFGDLGTVSMPVDTAFLNTPQFEQLFNRLHEETQNRLRRHMVQCTACGTWCEVQHTDLEAARTAPTWTCAQEGLTCQPQPLPPPQPTAQPLPLLAPQPLPLPQPIAEALPLPAPQPLPLLQPIAQPLPLPAHQPLPLPQPIAQALPAAQPLLAPATAAGAPSHDPASPTTASPTTPSPTRTSPSPSSPAPSSSAPSFCFSGTTAADPTPTPPGLPLPPAKPDPGCEVRHRHPLGAAVPAAPAADPNSNDSSSPIAAVKMEPCGCSEPATPLELHAGATTAGCGAYGAT